MTFHSKAAAVLLVSALSACGAIRGDQPVGEYVSDAAISTAIKSKLAVDRDAPAMSINVDTKDGNVLLTGTARTQSEKERVGQIARESRGVKAVRNEIVVRSQ
ncbi:MAG TPA: BON domain-containing protein [Burkholderiaceae bacterium]|jgi:hyperosmotically inducible periplasmic protein|nr:BON domain-containing protein [Burkholderiaceae bacterium]